MPAREKALDVQALLRTVHEEARALSGGRHSIVLAPGPGDRVVSCRGA